MDLRGPASEYAPVRRPIAMGPTAPSPLITVVVDPAPPSDSSSSSLASYQDPETRPETETFQLQSSLLCASSAYFTACLSRPCKERTEQTVHLTSFRPATFRAYARFLLTGLIFSSGRDTDAQFGAQQHPSRQSPNGESVFLPELRTADIEDAFIRARGQIGASFTETSRDAPTHSMIPAGATLLPSQPELALLLACYKLADFLEADDFRDAIVDALVEAVTEIHARYPSLVRQREKGCEEESRGRDTIDSYYFGSLDLGSRSGVDEALEKGGLRGSGGSGFFPTDAAVHFIYKHSERGSGIRKLVVDWGVLCLDHRGFDPHRKINDEDGDFLQELHARMRQFWVGRKGREGGFLGDLGALEGLFKGANMRCRYHEHGRKGGRCYRGRYLG